VMMGQVDAHDVVDDDPIDSVGLDKIKFGKSGGFFVFVERL
jgi:hypothetical protein